MSQSTRTEQEDRGDHERLTAVMRAGTGKLIAQALEDEMGELLVAYTDQQDEQGRAGP